MSKPKKHHFVPQAYLKFFSEENTKGEYYIQVFDKISGTVFTANIGDIAEKKNFNKVEKERFVFTTPNEDPLYYEYKYSEIFESRIPQIIRNITSTCTLCKSTVPVLTDNIKKDLAMMIIVQLLRTPQSRRYSYDIGRPISDRVIMNIREQIGSLHNNIRKNEFLSVLDDFEYNEKFINSYHLQFSTDIDRLEKYAQILIENRSWVIYENDLYKFIPFVTSDNPVVMLNMKTGDLGFGVNGLDNHMTVINMSLTPKYMVSMYHKRNLFGHYSQSYENMCIPVDDKKFVINQTLLQIEQATRQVYTKPSQSILLDALD